jgi:hypothetical protein
MKAGRNMKNPPSTQIYVDRHYRSGIAIDEVHMKIGSVSILGSMPSFESSFYVK